MVNGYNIQMLLQGVSLAVMVSSNGNPSSDFGMADGFDMPNIMQSISSTAFQMVNGYNAQVLFKVSLAAK